FFRDFASPSKNPDIRSADHLVDDLVKTQAIDPKRIYVSGWSNGAAFAHQYLLARHSTATPGGSRIAAAAVYAAADPYVHTGERLCPLDPKPSGIAPLLEVYRACDALVPCEPIHKWLASVGNPSVRSILLDARGQEVKECDASCGKVLGL